LAAACHSGYGRIDTTGRKPMSDTPDSTAAGTGDPSVSRSGWIILCPEENAQLGDTFFSSDEAFKVCNLHNQQTGHNAAVQPITNA
jgi:hypothetical protein